MSHINAPRPKISVVMPVYNVEQYIAEAIDSVLAQSLTDFELIIVDDGGNDRSMQIARSYEDPRIRIVSQPNRGLPGARNTGIAEARAPFIALLDSDDRYHPEKLMLHYVHLRASGNIGVSYAGSDMMDQHGVKMSVAMKPKLTNVDAGDILKRNPVGNGSAAVLRKSAIDRAAFPHPDEPSRTCWFDETFRQSEDIEFWVRLAGAHNVQFEGIEGQLTDYRIVGGALSANIVNQFVSWEKMIRKATEFAPELVAKHGRAARGYQLRYLTRRALQLGEIGFARDLMKRALAASPTIAIAEPVKTFVTASAVAVGSIIGAERFKLLMRPYLKGAA
ncbi:glycosyltransferase family 2 protein [Altererythrobacter sp. RZ02]|uniref:Glycosyltransferase family 2 protein n=1 Tax=Pontixanthobacter rizhaonensis TaxID=2730337 RepID=A0A848QLZ9_9SPHN|nr:glycosyltransferase family 2 protein [Pontixanthobacter rizhaonensis]NMW30596.1 glycosyltransferase family 2 protein [Pontixanthobacter rizhaonensis]